MESVIFEDSPLAHYLEGTTFRFWNATTIMSLVAIWLNYHLGQGEASHELGGGAKPGTPPSSPDSISFAPRGPSTAYSKFRRKAPDFLKLEVPTQSNSVVARFHNNFSNALNSRLRRTENARFLEEFRYTVIASQLLNDHANVTTRASSSAVERNANDTLPTEDHRLNFTFVGLAWTAGVAFVLVWAIHGARNVAKLYSSLWGTVLLVSILAVAVMGLYTFLRRKWLHYIRQQAMESVSFLVENSQNFDAVASAAIMLIQEVELVSRGYQLSTPIPPISRLDEQSQTRRCARLRRTLRSSSKSMVVCCAEAYETLRPLAVEADLERYHDIYEISQSDVQEFRHLTPSSPTSPSDGEDLRSLKFTLHKLHILRKLFLCSLLALDASGGKSDLHRWTVAITTMQTLSAKTSSFTTDISNILTEEQHFPLPPTPKRPLTPAHSRMRAQMRKLTSLSHGIRSLQAKMHILREESDAALDHASDDVSELGSNLLVQYDSIGADLKSLMQEWEEGRAALATGIDRNERRISLCGSASARSRASTPNSLSGVTVVGSGSPREALKILNGEIPSSVEAGSEDEEVFEAVALPRQRSTLTREERLAKMKEDRVRQGLAKEKAEASGNMLKELETVIKLRPRGRTTGRLGSL